MVAVWSILFIGLGLLRHHRYATFAFDLGTYDQGVWLLSRFKYPFVTVRGLNLFGHHMNPILLLVAPFYWLGGGGGTLLVIQVLVQASGAFAIYLLARDRLADRWLAVTLGAVLLLNPTYQYLTWEFFHPDALAISPFLFAYWAAQAKRWRWFTLSAILAVACKEDVALPMAVMGFVIWVREDRGKGLLTAAAALGWWLLSTRLLQPALLGGLKPFYDAFFGDFGATAGEAAVNVVRHPGRVLEVATRADRISYYIMMLAPLALLPLLAPLTFLMAVPMLAVNALTTFPYAREIRYHYAALVLVGLILATVEAIARLGRNQGYRRFLVGLLAASAFATTVAWGPSPISTQFRSGLWPLEPRDARHEAKKEAIAMLPKDVSVSAIYFLLPHVAHREKVYDFPEPFVRVNWGVNGEGMHDSDSVDWLLLDRQALSERDINFVDGLLKENFAVRFERDGILLAERTRPGGSYDQSE
jgi:uncharacterized membrane protein